MAAPLLLLQDIHLTFGSTPLLAGAELSVGAGERLSPVGRNGTGKSTLLRIAAGLVEPDGGSRFLQPGTTVRYLAQEPDFAGFATTEEFVAAGLGPGDDPHRARQLMEQLDLTGAEDPRRLSGGESRRAALARVLAPDPDILLLDEPTNHLDIVAIEALEQTLAAARSALVMISHDRRFLADLGRATVWLDRGVTRRHERGFADFESWRDTILEDEERDRHKLDRKIVREEDWLRYGVSARRTRNQRRLAALHDLRRERKDAAEERAAGRGDTHCPGCRPVRQAGDRSQGDRQELWRAGDRARRVAHHRARRPAGHRRPERRRQDDADQSADRRAGAGCGHGAARHQPRGRHPRPDPREPRPGGDRGLGAHRGARRHGADQRPAAPRRRLHEGLPVPRPNRRARR